MSIEEMKETVSEIAAGISLIRPSPWTYSLTVFCFPPENEWYKPEKKRFFNEIKKLFTHDEQTMKSLCPVLRNSPAQPCQISYWQNYLTFLWQLQVKFQAQIGQNSQK